MSAQIFDDGRPQCPSQGLGALVCHLKFGHDGDHTHYLTNVASVLWADDSWPPVSPIPEDPA